MDQPQGISDQSLYLMSFLDNGKCKFYNPLSEQTYSEDFPLLECSKSRFASSNFRWLLMMNDDPFYQTFFNIFTFEMVYVPSMLTDDKFEIFHFSSPPTSPDCTVVAMKSSNIDGTKIGFIKRGEKEWTISHFEGEFKTSFCNGVFSDGRYYCMGEEFNIGIFDVNTHDWKVSDKHIIPHGKPDLYRPIGMVEDNHGLLVVYESREHQQLYVARFDLAKMNWEKVNCLGDDKVLYVSPGASYLETTIAKEMSNKIYFPKFHGDSGVFYCLATNKYYSCDGRYSSDGAYRLAQPHLCTWFKPSFSKLEVEEWESLTPDGTPIHFYSNVPFFNWSASVRSEHPF